MYIDAFSVGLIYGLTICSWSCLPYIGPHVMGTQGGFVQGIRSTMVFSFGKLVSYAVLGALAGYFGSVISGHSREIFQKLSGLVILWLGYTMFFKEKSKCGKNNHEIGSQNQANFQLMLLGVTAGAVPCLPMSGILLYASTNNSATGGGLILTSFGLGTMISPLIVIAGGMGWISKNIGRKIPNHSLLLRRVCALILVISGIKLFLNGLVV